MKLWQIKVLLLTLLVTQSAFSQQPSSNIRSVDFANLTYPWTGDLTDPKNPKRTFTLKEGELPATRNARGLIDEMGVFLESVKYGDVTGDGVEEAIVSLSIQTGGSAIAGIIYIYTLRKNRPVLLWSRSTGDRADGGLHNVYAENGGLVVELNGPQRDGEGDCCAMRFTRRRYVWNGRRFRQTGRTETVAL
jgi:hypothetical protein